MHYLIYQIINIINKKIFIGKFKGTTTNIKLKYSSNKFLLEDIKIYGSNNFNLSIIKECKNENDLKIHYNLIVDDVFKSRTDTYNHKYIMSDLGKKHISVGRRFIEASKLKNKYKNLEYGGDILRKNKDEYVLKDFCKHGDLILKISEFNRIYKLHSLFCEKCRDEYLEKLKLNEDDIKNNISKISSLFIHEKQCSEIYIKKYYPEIYKSIILWSEHYKEMDFKERFYLAKHLIKLRPICLDCNKEVRYCFSSHKYNVFCDDHIKIHHSSKLEIELLNFIKTIYNDEIIQHYKIKNNIELDIFLPNLNIGIEFNGLYWHSEEYHDKYYHFNKWKLCKENGIKLITIWEDDWCFKKDIVKSIITNQIKINCNKIYARNTIVKIVDCNTTKNFLNNNHIQGYCNSHINLGLYKNDKLVSLMTFGKKRMIMKSKSDNEYDFELLRFCSSLNTTVIGGASKLFKYFINNYKPKTIISYANLDISNGNIYEILNFKNKKYAGIDYWWAKDKRYHRSNFMKYKLVKQGVNPNKTENEIMKENGFYKIWGVGNLKYEWKTK